VTVAPGKHNQCFAAGAFFSFFTGPVTRIGGRKLVMILGGASFCVGAILCAFAQDLAMLIIGRVCLGAGVGFANQVCITSLCI
jgi:MFS family permease